MKKISPNWFIRYGWLTGKPETSVRWSYSLDGKPTNREEYIVISLCGTFWRAVRTTFLGLCVATLLAAIGNQALFNTKVFFFWVGGSAAAISLILSAITIESWWKDYRKEHPKVKKPSIIKDTFWAIKHKVCPVYEVPQ